MENARILILNGKIVLPDKTVKNECTVLADGKIIAVNENIPPAGENDIVIDAGNKYISPGFIDIHVHGGGGHDFMDGNLDSFIAIAETHARYGTTAMLPTTLTSTMEELFNLFDVYEASRSRTYNGATFLGIHLEGPYFSYNQRGAQDPQYLKVPVPDHYMPILEASSHIRRWSIAPELEGALELGKELSKRNIIVSVAHTDAVCEEVIGAFHSGYTLMTHLYSAMSTVTRRNAYRYAGALEAAYLVDDMDVEIITDGIHLPKSLLQFVYKFKGVDRIALITDAMRGAGMPDGVYKLGSLTRGQDVLVEDGVAKMPDRTAFAGSVATMDRAVRTMLDSVGISVPEAVKMATLTPARILGVDDRKGTIAMNKDADIVIFDDNINVSTTIVGGRIVYNA